jgi:uncharacterized membrane protein
MEILISHVLRIGVLMAGAIVLLGLVLFFVAGSQAGNPRSLHDLTGGGGHPIATDPGKIARGVADGRPQAVIQLGLLVLILTPLARVAMTLVLFFFRRDWLFVVVTGAVLAVLVVGLIGIGA